MVDHFRCGVEAEAIEDITYRLDAYNFLMREHLKRTNPKFRAVWEAEQKEKEALTLLMPEAHLRNFRHFESAV